jgi:ABC-type transport system involved in multi-copper enzyme maturation permease subunit
MTAELAAPDASDRQPQPAPVRQLRRLLAAEWTKLMSVRSTMLALVVTGGMCVGFAVLLGIGTLTRWDRMSAEEHAAFQPATFSVSGVFFAQLVVGSLGVLAVSAEYSSGTIRATLSAAPQRLLGYLAKILVFAAVALVASLVTTFASFLAGQYILSTKGIGTTLAEPEIPRVVFGAALFLLAVGLLGLGLGAALRHTAGAVSTLFGLMLVLPILSNFLPSDWQENIDKWLPLRAGMAVMQQHPQGPAFFSPWVGLAVLFGYAAIALVAGAVVLQRRDA